MKSITDVLTGVLARCYAMKVRKEPDLKRKDGQLKPLASAGYNLRLG